MTELAPTLQAFFADRLARQKNASPHTIAGYRDTLRMLLNFAWQRTGTPPSRLDVGDLDAPLVSAFLDHLEHERGNSPRTRNARLAAIRSLLSFAMPRHPEHAATISRTLAIPPKRFTRPVVTWLTDPEAAALIAVPDTGTRTGRRDHALLTVALQTGLRASELAGLRRQDAVLGPGACLTCTGKGRKQRATPLTSQTVKILRAWLRERPGDPGDPLFSSSSGRPLTRDAIAAVVRRHATTAGSSCPSLQGKTVTPHTLRHSAAMRLLHAGVDTSVIALWLGHEKTDTVQHYLHADLALKEKALARTAPPGTAPGRYQPPDGLLAFLEAL